MDKDCVNLFACKPEWLTKNTLTDFEKAIKLSYDELVSFVALVFCEIDKKQSVENYGNLIKTCNK